MGQSVLVFISHSSKDKESYIEPIANDLEESYINVWLDKKKILPGDNLRKSIFRDGLDKADVVLIFFTQESIKSSWVDKEIKHILREESRKGNNFDLNKIISIFDSPETYNHIGERYPELTDDLLHLMPENYSKIQFGQLISAIWSKYLSLQGGDIETQKQLLAKEKEIFQKEKEILELKASIEKLKSDNKNHSEHETFKIYLDSGKLDNFIENRKIALSNALFKASDMPESDIGFAFGLLTRDVKSGYTIISEKGQKFFEWLILQKDNP
jgi:hypothetical protein